MRSRKPLDWERVRERLTGMRNAADPENSVSPQEREQIFRMRAELLAPRVVSNQSPESEERIITFRLGAARYAVPLPEVVEILANAVCAGVPGSSQGIAGVIQVRGEIRPVLALNRILGLSSDLHQADRTVLLLRFKDREFGIFVTSVEEIRSVGMADRLPVPPEVRDALWVTKDLVTVLNIRGLREGKGKPQ